MNLHLFLLQGLPGQPETVLSVAGSVLTVDGVAHDLTEWVAPDPHAFSIDPIAIAAVASPTECTVRVILGDTAAPIQPVNLTLTVGDGPVTIPAVRL